MLLLYLFIIIIRLSKADRAIYIEFSPYTPINFINSTQLCNIVLDTNNCVDNNVVIFVNNKRTRLYYIKLDLTNSILTKSADLVTVNTEMGLDVNTITFYSEEYSNNDLKKQYFIGVLTYIYLILSFLMYYIYIN